MRINATDGLVQYLFPAFVAHPVTPACDEFEFCPHLLQALGVDAEPSHTVKRSFVERVAEELAPRTCEIFKLSRIEGKTHDEIAKELGISVRSVEKHLQKSVQKYRSKFLT